MVTSYQYGHLIEFINGTWIYSDDKTSATISRKCKSCGKLCSLTHPDPCLGILPFVKSACCGHGVIAPFMIAEVINDFDTNYNTKEEKVLN